MITLNIPDRSRLKFLRNTLYCQKEVLSNSFNKKFMRETIRYMKPIREAIGELEGIPKSNLKDCKQNDYITYGLLR